MPAKVPISVLVMTKNEEANIRACLESVKWADEVVVVDSHSEDKTLEISREYTDKIHQFEWNGRFPKKKNWSIKNVDFANEWVLILDADERASDEFGSEVEEAISGQDNCAGYTARFDYFFMGRCIKHGDPVRKIVLFKPALASFEKLDDEELSEKADVEVHEHQLIEGALGKLKVRLVHEDKRNLFHYFDRHNRYSSWEAYLLFRKGYSKRVSDNDGREVSGLLLRRYLKRIFLLLPCKPFLYFMYGYILRMGFLDGYAGFAYNLCKAIYAYQIELKLYEMKQKDKHRG